ncbi:hypothetical protein AV530_005731 [Patagioenas fasciata monilis]|uniref:Uncharacterized protein n=1 Tax=Patagioenas fasciata monilis TaxID=372326 RepID=A0A1V4JMF0_PATFA|nr:hypothetical protein AV530_005731 [Patagioenas fasciata monilis]
MQCAHAYQALFNTIQYSQGEERVSGSGDKVTSPLATPTLVTGTAAEPENQPVLVSVTPVHEKKHWKSAHLLRDEEAFPTKKQEEEAYCPDSEEADYSEAGPLQELEEEEFFDFP